MRACRILALAVVLLPGRPVLANIRAPWVIPSAPSSAAFAVDAAWHLSVLSEDLNFHCQGQGPAATCAVQARYRIQARDPVRVELSFVMPLPAPLKVMVGAAAAAVRVNAAPATMLREEELYPWQRHHDRTPLPN